MDRVAALDLRFRAHLDLARTALAIERYRLATGAVPSELDELVPEHLQEMPLDPFDGRPIRYRRTESLHHPGRRPGRRRRQPWRGQTRRTLRLALHRDAIGKGCGFGPRMAE